MNVDSLLGQAYTLDQIEKHRQEAIKLIRDASAEPGVRPILEGMLQDYRAVHEARFDPALQRSGDHVSTVMKELLEAALR